MRPMPRLQFAFSVIFIAACPPNDIVFPEASTSPDGASTGSDSPTTSENDMSTATGEEPGTTGTFAPPSDCVELLLLSPEDIQQVCEKYPWGKPDCGTRISPIPTCSEVIAMLDGIPACSGITVCEYQQCAAAMADAPCGDRPAECDPILTCIAPEPPHTCSPGFCDDFEKVGLQAGLDPEFANELGKVCAWDPCVACSEVEKACADAPCPAIQAKCEAEMETCDCG